MPKAMRQLGTCVEVVRIFKDHHMWKAGVCGVVCLDILYQISAVTRGELGLVSFSSADSKLRC